MSLARKVETLPREPLDDHRPSSVGRYSLNCITIL